MNLNHDNRGVTPVLGVMLMLPTLAIGAVAVVSMMNAQIEYTQAATERMEILAECARNPDYQHQYCESETILGYKCTEIPQGLLCTKQNPHQPKIEL